MDTIPLLQRATLALAEDQLDLAESLIREQIDLSLGKVAAQAAWILGNVQFKRSNHSKALKLLEPLIEIPDLQHFSPLYRLLYITAFNTGDPEKAIKMGE